MMCRLDEGVLLGTWYVPPLPTTQAPCRFARLAELRLQTVRRRQRGAFLDLNKQLLTQTGDSDGGAVRTAARGEGEDGESAAKCNSLILQRFEGDCGEAMVDEDSSPSRT